MADMGDRSVDDLATPTPGLADQDGAVPARRNFERDTTPVRRRRPSWEECLVASPSPELWTGTIAALTCPDGPRALVDYFCVAGLDSVHGLEPELFSEDSGLDLPPIRRPYRAFINNHFPDERDWNKPFDAAGILMLCFPQGLLLRWKSESRYIRSHSFVMTKEDGTRIHGVTLIYYELVEDPKILAAMSTLQKMHNLQQAYDAAQRGEREPTAGGQKLKSMEPLYAQKAITIISQFPAVAIFEAYLRQLYSVIQMNESGTLPLECYISNLLFEVPAPRPGKAVRFQCTQPLRLTMPNAEDPRMCQYSFLRLFKIFTVDTVLIIYSIILLEEQVVLRSNDLSLLSLVAECFVELLFPFAWPYVYVPILPATQHLFLEAPMPFVMGLPGVHGMDMSPYIVTVNIDSGAVSIPEGLPPLPRHEWLRDQLNDILHKHRAAQPPKPSGGKAYKREVRELAKGVKLPPTATNPCTKEADTFNTSIRQAFLGAFVDTFVDLDTYLIKENASTLPPLPSELNDEAEDVFSGNTGGACAADGGGGSGGYGMGMIGDEANFDKAAFMSDQPDFAQPFLSRFLETQMFTSFIEVVAPTPADSGRLDASNMAKEREEQDIAIEELRPFLNLVRERRKEDRGGEESLNALVTNTAAKIAAKSRDWPSKSDFVAVLPMLPLLEEEDSDEDLGSFDHADEGPLVESSPFPASPKRKSRQPGLVAAAADASGDSPSTAAAAAVSSSAVVVEDDQFVRTGLFQFFVPDIINDAQLRSARQERSKISQWLETPDRPTRLSFRRSTPQPESNTGGGEVDASFSDILLANFAAGRKAGGGKAGAGAGGALSKLGTSHDHFVAALLADCAIKVKKCVVTGLGMAESVLMNHVVRRKVATTATTTTTPSTRRSGRGAAGGGESANDGHGGVNAVVLNLCQVLERTFQHGLRSTSGGRHDLSALWTFLDAAVNRSAKRNGVEGFRDIRLVRGMTFLRTDAGKARAWVRLCLEKKALSSALTLLLQDEALVQKTYKEYGCIAHHECRAFILQHLETLCVVDFKGLFTSNVAYRKALVGYHVEVNTSPGFLSGTSANVNVGFRGTLAIMKPVLRTNRPAFATGGSDSFVFEAPNLGMVTSVTVSVDATDSWTGASIKITNLLTGKTTMFPGWNLGKGEGVTLWPPPPPEDDATGGGRGSGSRAASVSGNDSKGNPLAAKARARAGPEAAAGASGGSGSRASRSGNGSGTVADVSEEADKRHVEVCAAMAQTVNGIVRFDMMCGGGGTSLAAQAQLLCGVQNVYLDPPLDRTSGEATETGLVAALLGVFTDGFKFSGLFGIRRHVWDFIEKAGKLDSKGKGKRLESDPESRLVSAIARANACAVPKDARFGMLVCEGASSRILHVWFDKFACAANSHFYESSAVLRTENRVEHLHEIVRYLIESPFNLAGRIEYRPLSKGEIGRPWHLVVD